MYMIRVFIIICYLMNIIFLPMPTPPHSYLGSSMVAEVSVRMSAVLLGLAILQLVVFTQAQGIKINYARIPKNFFQIKRACL